MAVAAVVLVSALDQATGDETYSFVVEDSAENVAFAAGRARRKLRPRRARSP